MNYFYSKRYGTTFVATSVSNIKVNNVSVLR